ncbi:MAG TPA: hypothetical protein VHL80_05165, partial [Polyangia bacterium]|nr:hypothetical protein [Polyangia bacterium]
MPLVVLAAVLAVGCDGGAVQTDHPASGGPGEVVHLPTSGDDGGAPADTGGAGGAAGKAGTAGAAGRAGAGGAAGHAGAAGSAGAGGKAGSGTTGAGGSASGGSGPGTAGGLGAAGSGAAGTQGAGGAGTVDRFAACTACEMTTCGADVPNPTQVQAHTLAAAMLCFTSTATAPDGPGKGMPRTTLCQAVLSCVHTTGCNAMNDTDCWCGIGADPALCFTPSFVRTGPCKAQIDAASESSSANDTEDRYTDYSYPGGAAFYLIDNCDQIQHARKGQLGPCQAICSGMTAAGGSGGGSGSPGAAGAGNTGGAQPSGTGGVTGASGDPGGSGGSGVAGTGAAGSDGTAGTAGTAGSAGAAGTAGGAGSAGSDGT